MGTIDVLHGEGPPRLVLRSFLFVTDASRLHDLATSLVEQGGDVAVDCAALEAVDTSVVQVLLALGRALEARGGRLRFTASSPVLDRLLALTGLEGAFTMEPGTRGPVGGSA
jgi:anti-anti-sigma factor